MEERNEICVRQHSLQNKNLILVWPKVLSWSCQPASREPKKDCDNNPDAEVVTVGLLSADVQLIPIGAM